MLFPIYRPRRLRRTEALRRMVRETRLTIDDFIYPLFVVNEDNVRAEIREIPNAYYLSGRYLVEEAREIRRLGIPAVLLFGIPLKHEKDEKASVAHSTAGPTQKAVRMIKDAVPELTVITDICLCEYTHHGHCGIVKGDHIENDLTLEVIRKIALSHAQSGADIVAPSAMMDGMVEAIREILDTHGYHQTLIMPYSMKFASHYYGPFKRCTRSSPHVSMRETHQLDFANSNEALRKAACDIAEGADILIVKPALSYLDMICRLKHEQNIPVAAFNVSGEYTMIYSAGMNNCFEREQIMFETLTCIKRAGADMIITYFAKEAAELLCGK